MRIFVVTVLLLAACSKKDPTKEFEKLSDRACECATDDLKCGSQVLSDVVSFTEKHKASDGDQNRITEAGKKLYDCLTMTGAKPKEVTAALEHMIE
jgi:hypothetical protein